MTSGERRRMINAVQTSNNSTFSAFLNQANDDNDVFINGGRLFQTFAAAMGKARSLIVWWFNRGSWSSTVDAECSQVWQLMLATRCNPSVRYCGVMAAVDEYGKTEHNCGIRSQWSSQRSGDTCSVPNHTQNSMLLLGVLNNWPMRKLLCYWFHVTLNVVLVTLFNQSLDLYICIRRQKFKDSYDDDTKAPKRWNRGITNIGMNCQVYRSENILSCILNTWRCWAYYCFR